MCNSEASPKCWIAELQVLQMDDLIECLWQRDVSNGKQGPEFWAWVTNCKDLAPQGLDLHQNGVQSWNHGHPQQKSSKDPGCSFMKHPEIENSPPKNMDSTMEQKGERTTTAALSGDEPLAYGACSRGSERGAVIRTWGFNMI